MRHLIKKQIIELTLDQGLNHFHVQQQVSERYWNEIVPMLEKAFDAISTEDELIEIDRFELDLGVVSEKEIEKESWSQEIRKRIQEKIAAITDPASSQYAIKSRDRRLGVFGQWVYYMEHGFLLWNTLKLDDKWYQDVLEAVAVDIKSHQTLQEKIREHPFFLQRVVSQHPEYFLHKLSEILTAKKQDDLPVYIDELLLLYGHLKKRKKIKGNQSDLEIKNILWQRILGWASGGKPYPDEQSLTAGLIRSFVGEHELTAKIPASLREKIPLVLPRLLQYSEDLIRQQQRGKKQITGIVKDLQHLTASKNKESGTKSADEMEQLSKYNSRAVDEEGIFIVNAGTVLLHPFLKSLFGRLGLINGNAFTSKQAQQTSLLLIHYLGAGQTNAKEYELTLAKVLCAFPMEEPVELPDGLPPEYLQEADLLLEAAIGQWEILKNTTVDGLREGFLQRGGKLFSKNGNLYLQVEKNSIDVLLDYLPWSLSMVILPWMKDILRVEWR